MKKFVIISLFLVVGIGIFSFSFLSLSKKNGSISINIPVNNLIPFKFQELTIPYLRNREYKSNLTSLEKLASRASYISYLTSYTSDGLKINGLVTKPNGEMPVGGWPAIVFVHGYIPPTLYKTTEKYIDYVDYLARNGFVVFKIDLRGHGDSEGLATGAYYSGDYVIDTLNAREALKESDFINPEKIGLWGHSMAGNITFRSFVASQNIPAVVIWAGAGYTYSDLTDYRINDNSYRPPSDNSEVNKKREELRALHGVFNIEDAFWKQVAPINYLDGVKGALEIHHAEDDDVVSIEYSRNLMSILDKSDISHQLYEYKTGGHNISGASFSLAMQRTVEFFNKYLKDHNTN